MNHYLIRYLNAPEYPITCTINTIFCIIYKFLHTNKLALTNTKNPFIQQWTGAQDANDRQKTMSENSQDDPTNSSFQVHEVKQHKQCSKPLVFIHRKSDDKGQIHSEVYRFFRIKPLRWPRHPLYASVRDFNVIWVCLPINVSDFKLKYLLLMHFR